MRNGRICASKEKGKQDVVENQRGDFQAKPFIRSMLLFCPRNDNNRPQKKLLGICSDKNITEKRVNVNEPGAC